MLKNNNVNGEWVICGDFNAIKNQRERKRKTERDRSGDTKTFDNFIIESNLVDIPCKGKSFTWYSGMVFRRVGLSLSYVGCYCE